MVLKQCNINVYLIFFNFKKIWTSMVLWFDLTLQKALTECETEEHYRWKSLMNEELNRERGEPNEC